MPSAITCPNDDSKVITFVIYWKRLPELKAKKIDAFLCHTCGQLTDIQTRQKLPPHWQPHIEWPQLNRKQLDTIGQVDFDGNISRIERTISPLPILLLEPSGEYITHFSVPKHKKTAQYIEMCRKMTRELVTYKPSYSVPAWYRYKLKKEIG